MASRRRLIGLIAILVLTGATDGAYTSARAASATDGSLPVHAWYADGTAQDAVGHDTGTLLRGATYAPGPNGGTDQAFSMSGTRQQVRFNRRGGNFGRHDFAVALDILAPTASKEAVIEKRPVCNAASFWDIRLDGSGLVQPEMMSDALGTDYTPGFSSTTSVADGRWHQILLSRAGRTASLYIDGTLEDTATTPHRVDLVNDSRMRIGMSVCVGQDGTHPFRGEIDDVRFYLSALAPADLPQ